MIRALALAVLLAAGLAGPAAAHRGHSVLTVVEVDRAANVAKVTHRMAAHDVEPALPTVAPDAQPSLDDPDAVRALQAYVADAFIVDDGSGPAPQEIVLTRMAGDEVELGYRVPLAPGASSLTFDSRLFVEVHPDIEVQVNLRVGGTTRTLVFHPSDGPQTLPLEP